MTLPDQTNLAQRTLRNVAWLSSSQAIRQVVSVLATILLARFLSPSDFGIFAMLIFVNELAQTLVDFGMGSALIQRKDVNQRLLSSCFWINVAVGASAAVILIALGQWIADYFGQPIIRWLLFISGLNLILASASVLPQVLLTRRLTFRDVAFGTLLGSLCGAVVAVGMALAGFGIWALAVQPVVGTLVNTLFLFSRARWFPDWVFDFSEVRGLLIFSVQLLTSSLVGLFSRSLPSLILGPAMGVSALGLITMAQTVSWLPVAQFSQSVVRATFPVFAQMQNDMAHFRSSLYRASGMIALLAFPMLTGIGLLASDLMPVVFGPKWVEAAPLVTVLCAMSMVQCVAVLSGTALLAAGKADLTLRLSLIGLVTLATALWFNREGSSLHAVLALAVAGVLLNLLTVFTALRAIKGGWLEYMRPLLRPLVCCVAMAGVLLAARTGMDELSALVRLVALSLLGAAAYVAFSLQMNRTATLEAVGLLRTTLKR